MYSIGRRQGKEFVGSTALPTMRTETTTGATSEHSSQGTMVDAEHEHDGAEAVGRQSQLIGAQSQDWMRLFALNQFDLLLY